MSEQVQVARPPVRSHRATLGDPEPSQVSTHRTEHKCSLWRPVCLGFTIEMMVQGKEAGPQVALGPRRTGSIHGVLSGVGCRPEGQGWRPGSPLAGRRAFPQRQGLSFRADDFMGCTVLGPTMLLVTPENGFNFRFLKKNRK